MSTPHKLIKLCKVDLKKKDTYMTIHVQTNIIIHTHTHTTVYTLAQDGCESAVSSRLV